MRIAIDIHGVLDTNPDVYKPMLTMLKKTGHTLSVVTGPEGKKAQEELKELGYSDKFGNSLYFGSNVHSVVDFLKGQGVVFTYDENNNPWCDEQTWWDAKARICKHYGFDIMIDDSLKYKPAFDLIDKCEFIYSEDLLKGKI